MKQRNYRPVLVTLAMAMFVAPLQPSFGGVISTQEYLVANDRDAALARVNTVLARTEVRARLNNSAWIPLRLRSESPRSRMKSYNCWPRILKTCPRAAVLAVVGIVAIVLLVLELLDVTDLFKKI